MESFLSSIGTFLKLMPDYRPKHLAEKIRPKCRVLYFPIDFPQLRSTNPAQIQSESFLQRQTESSSAVDCTETSSLIGEIEKLQLTEDNDSLTEDKQNIDSSDVSSEVTDAGSDGSDLGSEVSEVKLKKPFGEDVVEKQRRHPGLVPAETTPLKIVWAHRWEHDKNPELFFTTMYKLLDGGVSFRISVLGENFSEIPDIFKEAYKKLKNNIDHWGFQQSKEDYYTVLIKGDVAVSTANHEFYGVAMLEAVHCGCFPLCPNELVYPEIFPKECLYNTDQQLFKHLRRFCRSPGLVRNYNRSVLNEITNKCSWTALRNEYMKLFAIT